MTRIIDPRIDAIDLKILAALEMDGRLASSALAGRLGTSRACANRRLQRLLDEKITRVVTYTNPRALGYRASALIGIKTLPGQLNAVAERLCDLPGAIAVIIGTGRHDIFVWTLFAEMMGIVGFLDTDVGSIPGIASIETTIVMEWPKLSFAYLTGSVRRREADRGRVWQGFATGIADDSGMAVDATDLRILSALEADGRKPVSILAKELHVSRANVARRIERILDSGVATIASNTNPPVLGYRFFAMIGIKVQPGNLGSVVKRVCDLSSMHWVMTVSGGYDVVAYAMFGEPREMSDFMETELGSVAGIASVETAIGLELRKFGFPYLAGSYLRRRAGQQ